MLPAPKQTIRAILNEPYRIFFPLGAIIGALGVGHWLSYALGFQSTYSVYFHGFLQTHVFLGCFVAGFLFTSIPRFSGAPHATLKEVAVALTSLLLLLACLSSGIWLGAAFFNIVFLLNIGRFVIVRFRKVKMQQEPPEFVWIPMGIFHGIVGTLIYVTARMRWAPVWMLEVGTEMSELGFILCVVIGIGGFLVPRLLGRQRLYIQPLKDRTLEQIVAIRRKRVGIHFLAGAGLFISFWLEGLAWLRLSFLLRAFIITFEFIWTGSIPFPPRTEGAYAKMLWLSIWMVALGSWALFFFPDQEKTMLHFIFIGGFSLMIFAVATVVVLSHSGEAARLQHRIWILRIILFSVVSALFFRILAPYFPERYFSMIGHAAGFWITAAIAWLFLTLPKLFKVPGSSTQIDEGPCQVD